MATTGTAESDAYKALFNKAYGEAAELAKTSKGDPVVARTLMRKADKSIVKAKDEVRMKNVNICKHCYRKNVWKPR